MREIVEAETFSPSTGTPAPRRLCAWTALNKNTPTTPYPPSGSAGRSAQRAWWETSPFGCAALKARYLPSQSTGALNSDHFDNRADPLHARSATLPDTPPSLGPSGFPKAPLELGVPSV